jgi:hypothetical protein
MDAALWRLIVTMVGINWAGLGSLISHCFNAALKCRSQEDLDGLCHSCRVSSVSRRCQSYLLVYKWLQQSHNNLLARCLMPVACWIFHTHGPTMVLDLKWLVVFLESFNAKISSLKYTCRCSETSPHDVVWPHMDYESVSSRHLS